MKNRKDFWVPWLIIWGIVIAFFLGMNALAYFCCDGPDCNHRFLVFKIASQIFILATAITWIICHFIDYAGMNKGDDDTVRMKFNHFKDVYYVNPNRWNATYKNYDIFRLRYRNGENYWRQDSYYVTFSYFDWLKFLLWKKTRNYEEHLNLKRKKEEESNKRMAEMLKYIQKDIDEAYEKISGEKGGQK